MSRHFNQRRLILDSLLVLALIAVIFSYQKPWSVNAEQQRQSTAVTENNHQDYGQPIAESTVITATEVTSNTVLLDNLTTAAVIAAENAALTPPQYSTSLPVITK